MKHYFLDGWSMADTYHESLMMLVNQLEKGRFDQN